MNAPTVVPGGLLLEVTLLDGTTQKVNVRQLPVRQLAILDEMQGDEPALVETYCGQEEGWADRLTHESYGQLVEAGDDLNAPGFADYVARSMKRLKEKKDNLDSLSDAGLLPAAPPKPKVASVAVAPANPTPVPEPPAATPPPVQAAAPNPA